MGGFVCLMKENSDNKRPRAVGTGLIVLFDFGILLFDEIISAGFLAAAINDYVFLFQFC